jgi:hypothetical protein
MVDVGMTEHQRIHLLGVKTEGHGVTRIFLFAALDLSTIQQQPGLTATNQVAGTGDFTSSAVELQINAHVQGFLTGS